MSYFCAYLRISGCEKFTPRTLLNYAKGNSGVKLYNAYFSRIPNCFPQTRNMSLSTYSKYRPCSSPRSSDSHIFEKPFSKIIWGTEIKYCSYYRHCTKTYYNNKKNNIRYIIYYLAYQLYRDSLALGYDGLWVCEWEGGCSRTLVYVHHTRLINYRIKTFKLLQ